MINVFRHTVWMYKCGLNVNMYVLHLNGIHLDLIGNVIPFVSWLWFKLQLRSQTFYDSIFLSDDNQPEHIHSVFSLLPLESNINWKLTETSGPGGQVAISAGQLVKTSQSSCTRAQDTQHAVARFKYTTLSLLLEYMQHAAPKLPYWAAVGKT